MLAGPHITTWSSTNPNPVDLGPYYYKWADSFGSIVDDPTRVKLRYSAAVQRLAFKPVVHVKWSAEHNHSLVTFKTSSTNWQSCNGLQVFGSFTANPANASFVTSALMQIAGSKTVPLDNYYSQWSSIRPTMATRLNLSVFLYELRDIRRMFDLIPPKHIRIGRKRRAARSWNETLKYAKYMNGQHLNYSFGWKPFLRDLEQVMVGCVSFEDRFLKFVGAANTELRQRRRGAPVITDGELDSPTIYYPFRTKQTWEIKTSQSSTFDYLYDVSKYTPKELRWRAWLDTLGLNVNPSTIWAVIPWSFVVDWFYRVGGTLGSVESDWAEPELTFHQGCHSIKKEGTFALDVYSSLGGTQRCVELLFSSYDRKVGNPCFQGTTYPLDADKIRLGSSLLLGQIMPKLHR